MGTGKTAVGREVARRQKRHFADLDEIIEFKERRRIAEIFAKEGEPYFRKLEKKALLQVSREKDFVIACGGGIVLDKDNIRIMKDSGIMICLSAKPRIILKRVYGNASRPLLNVKNPLERIELMLKMRSPYYKQAHKTIDTSGLSVKEVAARISRIIKLRKR